MKYKIIVDSSCDLKEDYIKDAKVCLDIAPLKINVGEKEFTDDDNLQTDELLDCIDNFKGKSCSSCPSPDAFLSKMKGADKYFIITLSSKLSGSYNSAINARNSYSNPENVFVINSNLVSGAMILIVDKLVELIHENLSFEEICTKIYDYTENHINLLFVLDKFKNLVKNGRISPLKAMIASSLNIKPLCEGKNGEIKVIKNLIGAKRAFKELIANIGTKLKDFISKKCIITHCKNEEKALDLKTELTNKKFFKEIRVLPMRGLCSFYAMQKGIIVSYES